MDISIRTLAAKYKELGNYINEDGSFEFNNSSQNLLFKLTLDHYFSIKLEPSFTNLCPTVPNRIKYIAIVDELLRQTCTDHQDVIGLDIGTGCYAVYCILAAKIYGWRMCGTDINKDSIAYAEEIVKQNQLQDRIELRVQDSTRDKSDSRYTFSICNPPFYESRSEMSRNTEFKDHLQREEVVGLEDELITENGEVGFITSLIKQSLTRQEQITWHTSLIGKYSSVNMLIQVLIKNDVNNFCVREFMLGSTKRWVIIWSLQKIRPMTYKVSNFKQIPITVVKFEADFDKIIPLLKKLELEFQLKDGTIVVEVNGNVWSRSYRRGKTAQKNMESIFRITKEYIYWYSGDSQRLFQSFYTFLQRKQTQFTNLY